MARSPNRTLALVVGAASLLIGALGFTVTTGVGFFGPDGALLLGIFEVNGLQNVVHLLIGAALLLAGLSGVRAARTANVVLGIVFLLLGIAGLFIAGTQFDILALNVPDHAVHFGSAVLLLAAGLGAEAASGPPPGAPKHGAG